MAMSKIKNDFDVTGAHQVKVKRFHQYEDAGTLVNRLGAVVRSDQNAILLGQSPWIVRGFRCRGRARIRWPIL